MAAVAWYESLQKLPLSQEEKGAIIGKLYLTLGQAAAIQRFFDACIKCGGEKALISGLQGLLQGQDISVKKRVQIYHPKARGEELVFVANWFTLKQESFDRFVRTGYLVPLKGRQMAKGAASVLHFEDLADRQTVLHFEDLVDGETYILVDYHGVPYRMKMLENYTATEMQVCEDELAATMIRELQVHGLAENPISCRDLRVHCQGSSDEQEFDAVLLDGEDKLFIGSAKHMAHGTSEVEDMLRNVRVLTDRARNIERFPSYAPFQGRAVGCCIRLDTIKEARRQDVKHLCSRKGIALFQWSGAALTMQNIPFVGPQSLEPGFINMVVRGFKRFAR